MVALTGAALVPERAGLPTCPCSLRADDVMSRHVLTIAPETTVAQALAVMRERRVRHLPVVVDGRLTGLVDERLVARAGLADRWPDHRPVAWLMAHYVAQVRPDAPLPRVARLVGESGCDAVVVVDEDLAPVGLVTAADVVSAVAARTCAP